MMQDAASILLSADNSALRAPYHRGMPPLWRLGVRTHVGRLGKRKKGWSKKSFDWITLTMQPFIPSWDVSFPLFQPMSSPRFRGAIRGKKGVGIHGGGGEETWNQLLAAKLLRLLPDLEIANLGA